MASELTFRQREIVNYMRGNNGRLSVKAREGLIRRGVWSDRGISMVLAALAKQGLVCRDPASRGAATFELTEVGKRV